MYLIIEENANCIADERVFSTSGDKRAVDRLLLETPAGGSASWCEVAAVNDDGSFGPAHAQQVEDSSDGTAWLIFGGTWGLRFRSVNQPWSLTDKTQWGVPFLVLESSGAAIRFK